VVTLPSRLVPGGRFKVVPAVRVGKLMQREETLHGWAPLFLAMASCAQPVAAANAEPSPAGGS
jgi:hypothetical protein